MRVRFIHLTLRDFKSFEGFHELPLDLPIGVHFMRGRNSDEKRLGSNGSGKSTIWDAVVWCLYGATPSGLRNPDVVPWTGAKRGTRVALVLEIDKRRVVVARTASPNTLTIDGKDVGPEAVVELIGMSFEVMTNTIILGQGRPLFFDKTPSEKMKLLSDVKGLERWDERSKRAGEKTSTLERELDTLRGEANGLSRTVGEISAALKELQPKEEEWQRTFEIRLEKGNEFKRVHGKRMERLQNEIAGADLKYDSAMTEVKALEREVQTRVGQLSEARNLLTSLRDRRTQLTEKIAELEKEYKACEAGKSCPTCGQRLKQDGGISQHRAKLIRAIKYAEKDLSELSTKKAKRLITKCEAQFKGAQEHLDTYHKKADEALREHKALQGELAELNAELNQIKQNTDEAEENPHTKSVRMLRKRRGKLRREHEECTQDVVSCEKELTQTRPWVKGFKEIKLHVIEELLQELELATAGMLEEVGLIGWRVRYVIERETKSGKTSRALSIMIGSPKSGKKLVRWESWSGGEGQRLRVVGALALASVLLNHAGVVPSMEVLDEPTQHLSDEGVHDLCDYLAERAQSHRRRIFYCDHQSVDGAAFASTITIRRDARGSRVSRGVT